jgi:basic amino acid/polyamine antiporter, APA family
VDNVLANGHIDSHGDPVPGKGHLARNLSAWDLTRFGIGIVIGTGIFALTGLQARNNAGPAIMISYTYAYTTIGEIFAWIIAWDLILEFALGAAVAARGWSGYLLGVYPFLPSSIFGEDSMVNLGAFIVLVLGAVAIKGVREPPG